MMIIVNVSKSALSGRREVNLVDSRSRGSLAAVSPPHITMPAIDGNYTGVSFARAHPPPPLTRSRLPGRRAHLDRPQQRRARPRRAARAARSRATRALRRARRPRHWLQRRPGQRRHWHPPPPPPPHARTPADAPAPALAFAPRSVTGIDKDAALVNKAKSHLSFRWSRLGPAGEVDYFPASAVLAAGHVPYPVPVDAARFPHNVHFAAVDFVRAPAEAARYGVVLMLSVVKWMHLQGGDQGLTLWPLGEYTIGLMFSKKRAPECFRKGGRILGDGRVLCV